MNKLVFIFVVICLMPLSNVSSEIYKYIDEKGAVVFTDNLGKVPEDQRPNVKEYKSNNKNINSSTENKRENVQRYNSEETTSNKSISGKQTDEQFKEMMKKAIEEEYGIEVKESCPDETETDRRRAIETTWAEMSNEMIDGNLEKALSYFSMMSRDQNKRKMMNLSKDQLKSIYGSFEKLEIYTLNKGNAECGAIRTESSGSFSYPVRFVRDLDCVWRIQGL